MRNHFTDYPSPHSSGKKNNTLLIILFVLLGIPFLMFVVGMIAAIVIPQFNRLHDRANLRLVLDVKVDKAVESHLELVADELLDQLQKKNIGYQELVSDGTTGISVILMRKEDEADFKDLVAKNYPEFELHSGAMKETGTASQLALREKLKDAIKKNALKQVLETIRDRCIDVLGIRGADIRQQGDTRILIQLRGVKDPQTAIELLCQRGLLEFKLVDTENMVGD